MGHAACNKNVRSLENVRVLRKIEYVVYFFDYRGTCTLGMLRAGIVLGGVCQSVCASSECQGHDSVSRSRVGVMEAKKHATQKL